MERPAAVRIDSPFGAVGGAIPGLPDVPAFRVSGGQPAPVPILIAVPHAGRAYPAETLDAMRNAPFAALRLEDRLADRLGEAVARATGARLLLANAPRALIDLNRAQDDIDWGMIEERPAHVEPGHRPGLRARSGLGLVPRRLPGLGEVWKRPLAMAELAARIAAIHAPYHARLEAELALLRARWGAALLIDLHSMPPLAARPGQPAPGFVLGDRFGASCNGGLVASAFSHFARTGSAAAHNRPYAGGYVLERHADPARGLHAIQIEVDRGLYLDSALAESGPGFAAVAEVLAGLVRRLAADVAGMGRGDAARWAEAAE